MQQIHKYPRTRHIQGSRLQPGDEDLAAVPFHDLSGRHLVVEEKIDGANSAVSFSPSGELLLQSRGHYLTGGPREKHFDLFKQWAATHAACLYDRLGDRYVMYGEWTYAKHTVYYDALPHYFMEFDMLDTTDLGFLSTPRRRKLLEGLPVVSVPVLYEGSLKHIDQLTSLIGPSLYIQPNLPGKPTHMERLRQRAQTLGLDPDRAIAETDRSGLMEGLYIKVEAPDENRNSCVLERYKYVRADFLTAVFAAEGHWLNRPTIPNLLADSVDLFDPSAGKDANKHP